MKLRRIRLSGEKKRTLILRVLILFLLATTVYLLSVYTNRKAIIATSQITENRAKAKATLIINECVSRLISEFGGDRFVSVAYDTDGKVLSITVNSSNVSEFTSKLNEKINRSLSRIIIKTEIPLGSVLAPSVFPGRGPFLTVRSVASGSASLEISSSVTGAGVNQSLHSLYVSVVADISILTSSGSRECTVKQNILIAETLTVGKAPLT